MTAPDQLKTRIRGWFLSVGWQVEDGASPDAPWAIRGKFGNGPSVTVYQQQADQIVLRCTVGLSESQQKRWALQTAEQRNEFLWDLRFRLLASRAEFEVVGEVEGEIREVRLHERIFEDGLTKDRFWQRLRTVRNAAILALYLFAFGAGEPTLALFSEVVN